MKTKAVGVVLVLMSSVALAQKEASPQEASKADGMKAQVGRALLGRMLEFGSASGTRLKVDFADETILGVTVTDRQGGIMLLDFEPNETSDDLRPVLPEGTQPEIFGRDFFGFGPGFLLSLKLAGDPNPNRELLPFDTAAAEQPHDDASVFVVDKELVLIGLWQNGQRIGTYYAVDMDAVALRLESKPDEAVQSAEDVVGGAAAKPKKPKPTPKQVVCRRLGDWCTAGQQDMPTVAACALWLLFCQGV